MNIHESLKNFGPDENSLYQRIKTETETNSNLFNLVNSVLKVFAPSRTVERDIKDEYLYLIANKLFNLKIPDAELQSRINNAYHSFMNHMLMGLSSFDSFRKIYYGTDDFSTVSFGSGVGINSTKTTFNETVDPITGELQEKYVRRQTFFQEQSAFTEKVSLIVDRIQKIVNSYNLRSELTSGGTRSLGTRVISVYYNGLGTIGSKPICQFVIPVQINGGSYSSIQLPTWTDDDIRKEILIGLKNY